MGAASTAGGFPDMAQIETLRQQKQDLREQILKKAEEEFDGVNWYFFEKASPPKELPATPAPTPVAQTQAPTPEVPVTTETPETPEAETAETILEAPEVKPATRKT